MQGYNCLLAVDKGHQVIVLQTVTSHCPDNGNLLPLLDQIEQLCEQIPSVGTGDAGYWSPDAEPERARRGTELYIAPDRQRHRSDQALPEPDSDEEPSARDPMRKKLQTP